ncbi:protein MFI [Lampetra fluviatilis]
MDEGRRMAKRAGHEPEMAREDRVRSATGEDQTEKAREGSDEVRGLLESHRRSAIVIQRAWRRYIDLQVFRYYRELLSFRASGEPRHMLRCVNPKEAELLDGAAGAHVRFRLGGERFPPNIYYKIFTHRPVQDLCANSPKVYAAAAVKTLPARPPPRYSIARHGAHGTGARATPGTERSVRDADPGRSGWYKRVENNGWRLVSERLVGRPLAAQPCGEAGGTVPPAAPFSPSRRQRSHDSSSRRRRRQIQWLRKLYEGGQHAPGSCGSEGTAPGPLVDSELEDLLTWTKALDFEEYINGWKELGTTNTSDRLYGFQCVGWDDPKDVANVFQN